MYSNIVIFTRYFISEVYSKIFFAQFMFYIGVNMPSKCILANRRNKHAVFASYNRLLHENCLNEEVKFSKRFFSRTASDTGHSKLVLSPFPLRPHRCRRGFAAEDDKAQRSISDTNKSGPGFTYHGCTQWRCRVLIQLLECLCSSQNQLFLRDFDEYFI